jgi:ketopantoate reductase
MTSFAPAVGAQTAILPLLNGLGHFDALQQRFGAERVLGGLCMISAALDAAGTVQHFNDFHVLVFGELDGTASARVAAIQPTAPARSSTRGSRRRCGSSSGRSGSSSPPRRRSPA